MNPYHPPDAAVGTGNAAFETANALNNIVNFVHVFNGHAKKKYPMFSWYRRCMLGMHAPRPPRD